mmetsp:Transcript_154519/g.494225  ORF Transcript_154519/g.494225 Transcript_154519/m.494225 type:complete len:225 (+) Transcript_154519:1-675(+)
MPGPPRTRGNLPKGPVEEPREEPVVEIEETEPEPDRRLPYKINLDTHFTNGKHLKEDTATRKWITDKIIHALEREEGMIREVDARFEENENFHVGKATHIKIEQTVDGQIDVVKETSARAMGNYQFKVVVKLKTHREVVYTNPEKHAAPTISEATDLMADGLKRLMRDEKERTIDKNRKAKNDDGLDMDMTLEDDDAVIAQEQAATEDRRAEEEYQAIEDKLQK